MSSTTPPTASRSSRPATGRDRSRSVGLALRGQERQLIEALDLRGQDTVDLALDASWLSKLTAQPRKLMWRLVQKDLAHRLQAGRYLVDVAAVPRARPRVKSLDPLGAFLLERLSHDYYLSWHSALWRHGLVDQQSRKLYVAIRQRKRPASFGAWSVRFVDVAERKFFDGRRPEERAPGAVRVATVEKALIDSFDRPALAGGMATVVVALRRAHRQGLLGPQRLVDDAIRFNGPTLNRRLGFFMERYGIPGFEPLRLRIGKGYAVPLSPGADTGDLDDGRVDTRWGVRLDPTLLRAADVPK